MVYKRAKQKVRRVYSRGKSLFGGDIFKNPFIVGIAAGVAKNALEGKKIIDVENIKERISKVDGTNPLIFLGAGLAMKNPLLTAIGLFRIIDPPDDTEKKEEYIGYSNVGENEENMGYSNVGESRKSVGYSNVRENEEPTGYSNIGENEEVKPKKRCVY